MMLSLKKGSMMVDRVLSFLFSTKRKLSVWWKIQRTDYRVVSQELVYLHWEYLRYLHRYSDPELGWYKNRIMDIDKARYDFEMSIESITKRSRKKWWQL